MKKIRKTGTRVKIGHIDPERPLGHEIIFKGRPNK